MALDQSALLEVLDALRNADAADRITQAAQTIYRALIDAELTAVIGAGPHERSDSRINQRNGSRPGRCPRLPVIWSCVFPSCAAARSSRHCWNGGSVSISACSRW